jgi:ferredoxin
VKKIATRYRSILVKQKIPSIDLGKCSECGGCIEVAPTVFAYNASTRMMEVLELKDCPVDLVDEAMKNCPEDCISWEFVHCPAIKKE